MSKRVMLSPYDITRVANMADARDVYTAQSEMGATLYMWDGDDVGLYFHSAMLRMSIEEAEKLCEELRAFIEDLRDFKRMDLEFKGLYTLSRGECDAKQRKNNNVSVLQE